LDLTFGNDKNEKIEGLQASVNRLSNEFEKLWQSEKATRFFSAVANGLTDITTRLNKLMNSSNWKNFFLRVSSVATAPTEAIFEGITGNRINATEEEADKLDKLTKAEEENLRLSNKIAAFDKKNHADKMKEYKETQAALHGLARQYENLKSKGLLTDADKTNILFQDRLVKEMRANLGLDNNKSSGGLSESERKRLEEEKKKQQAAENAAKREAERLAKQEKQLQDSIEKQIDMW